MRVRSLSRTIRKTNVHKFTHRIIQRLMFLHSISRNIKRNSEIRKLQSKILSSALELRGTSVQEKSQGLKTATEKIDEYGKKLENSVQSVDEANSQYVNELSKAAEILRSKTNKE